MKAEPAETAAEGVDEVPMESESSGEAKSAAEEVKEDEGKEPQSEATGDVKINPLLVHVSYVFSSFLLYWCLDWQC